MPLDKQIQILNVDTGNFYSNKELYLHRLNHKIRLERNKLKKILDELETTLFKNAITKDDIRQIQKGEFQFPTTVCLDSLEYTVVVEERNTEIKKIINTYKIYYDAYKHKTEKAKETKNRILLLLKHKIDDNIKHNGKHHIRKLRFFDNSGNEIDKYDDNIISVFDSSFTRTIGALPDHLSKDFMVVQVYYFDVIKDLIYYGFEFEEEKYIYFTSSAGQIRVKKCVFIKESVWKKFEKTIMCGLTIDDINKKGGNNPNKHLAYMALSNSATDEWKEFDINKTIVIDDFETNVYGVYDYINDSDYSIKRESGFIPIPHTDGCGMILPYAFGTKKKNMMIRLPWIKGLLGVFDYKKFIDVNKCSPIIKDIYGIEHNVINEDIQIIFTKSQFKLWKFYDNWNHYKQCFKKNACTAGFTNVEEDKIKNTTINYQMLQSLTDITEDEIKQIVKASNDKLTNICTSLNTVMDIFGATFYNQYKTPFQEAIVIYPNLLNDAYVRSKLGDIKNSLVKQYKAGKIQVYGKYTFILPDLYAACERWFQGIENPIGLLSDGEVYCNLFRKSSKLDCLRSPHLYREHAIRMNVASDSYNERRDSINEWFCTNALYTSSHDLISKLLQFDVDGDKSLVVADKILLPIVERNVKNIVPLYYDMKKAKASIINNENIYNGLVRAFTWSNIGIYSNNISKIWNSEVFISGTEEEKQRALDNIKRLTAQNNYVIDAAKTLYIPEFPDYIKKEIQQFTRKKLPHFFIYAKDKERKQVEKLNDSFVNKLDTFIVNPKISFKFDRTNSRAIIIEHNNKSKKIKKPNFMLLMANPDLHCYDNRVIELYDSASKQYRYKIASAENTNPEVLTKTSVKQNVFYLNAINYIKQTISETGYTDEEIADMLVLYLYGNDSKRKQVLWTVYGDILLNNLRRNKSKLPKTFQTKTVKCIDCGEWFETSLFNSASYRCHKCNTIHQRELSRLRMKRLRKK